MVNAIYDWIGQNRDALTESGVEIKLIKWLDDSPTSARSICLNLKFGPAELQIICWEKGDYEHQLLKADGSAVEVVYAEVGSVQEALGKVQMSVDLLKTAPRNL